MAYKPDDFFIGIIDFFGILLPGSIVVFLYNEWFLEVAEIKVNLCGEATQWIAFIVSSYVIGHFVLGAGDPLNRLLEIFSPARKDLYYQEVKERIFLAPAIAKDRINAFYRAYSIVRLESPVAISKIERLTAEFKLFRGLAVVSLLSLLVTLVSVPPDWNRPLIACVVFVFALWRFLFLLNWAQRLTFEYYALLTMER